MKRLGVVLSGEAEKDFAEIISWTSRHFGARQAIAYANLIIATLAALEKPGEPRVSRAREDIGPALRSLHVARGKQRGRHMVLYRREAEHTFVLRILHDAMDISRHLPENES